MFAALFLPNLLAFMAGQAAAWFYLRSGRFWVGMGGTVLLWVLLDWWLLARFVYAADAGHLRWPAGLLQLQAVWIVVALAWARWRRRHSAVARQRTARFADGLREYLCSDYAAARATFTRLVRTDPWDVPAWIALGDVWNRLGRTARAQRCYRRASAVDTQRGYHDVLQPRRDRSRAS